ncbi:LysR family transcriptional regulator [Sphingomonas sp. RRHST34]|jgi:DNA-binding transcriptional LysR family regulator|uniref:LysR family transcriptional regulator n=1 Tax=Sphingomonas citri TaxID=2862499 RepID=A0ABS7BU67_9SPHN|nr:LysR family transcriptional regulator [Sphingomonas citri]MBW6533131.1 LysR family transcriptional regulator [Sphingomonas citri]
MSTGRGDLPDLSYFLVIARHLSFARAAVELRVTASALSHSMKALEARLGVRLLHRTNRSVTLTAAGEQLRDSISDPLRAIDGAIEALNRFRDAPAGRIRLNVVVDAARLLLAPVLPGFVELYPDIEVDVVASNRLVDVVGEGFDAGIRYGGTVPEDMIALRLSRDIRWVVAAAPAYLERFGTPGHPRELAQHRCVRLRQGAGRIYHWEFERGDEELAIDVPGALTIDDTDLGLTLARGGAGLMYGPEPVFAGALAEGSLRLVLEDWAAVGGGYHLYYSSRRQVPTALRLLADHIRERRPLG